MGMVQVSLAGVLWGTGGITLEVVRDHADLSFVTISSYRMLIAAAVLVAAVVVVRRTRELVALLLDAPGTACLVGVGTGAYQALYFGSVGITKTRYAVGYGLLADFAAVAAAIAVAYLFFH